MGKPLKALPQHEVGVEDEAPQRFAPSPTRFKRRYAKNQDIERAKGLAILLVVFGHIVARADPHGVGWYEPLRRAVYAFHMPFFLYLSGVVAVYSGAIFTPRANWTDLVKSRADRLLVPFFALGGLIVCGKVLAARFMFVDNAPAGLSSGLASLIWHTQDSPALSIWYLFVLFCVSVAAPVLVWADRRLRCLLAIGFLLFCLPLPAYLYLDHVSKYAIFFCLGACAAAQGERWVAYVDQTWRPLSLVFLFALASIAAFGADWPVKPELLVVGILSMPVLHGLVRHLSLPFASIFLWLGRHSFMIYLFNTICIGFAKGVMLRITSWDGSHFLPFAAVLVLSGTLAPIGLKRVLFERSKILARYTR